MARIPDFESFGAVIPTWHLAWRCGPVPNFMLIGAKTDENNGYSTTLVEKLMPSDEILREIYKSC